MVGPFTSYAPPGVYTQTLFEQTLPQIFGGLRIPVLIGVAAEVIEIDDFELFRGSSAQSDILVTDEDLTSQIQLPLTNQFQLANTPVVTGNGSGTVTTNPSDVTVSLNGQPVSVVKVNGATGVIFLAVVPIIGDTLTVTYFFRRKDTLVTNEDDSVQVDGVNVNFKVQQPPIVVGDDGGTVTTDPTKVTVTVDAVPVTVKALDGLNGIVTLAVAPSIGQKVLITYFTNKWQNTFDYLPARNVEEVLRVGLAPGREDFVENVDYVVFDNKIFWGKAAILKAGSTLPGSIPFDEDFIQVTLIDNAIFMDPIGVGDGVNTTFFTQFQPVDGSGLDIPTDVVSLMQVFVGPTVAAALIAGPVVVEEVFNAQRKVVLKIPPGLGNNVYATYRYSLATDDVFTITVDSIGGPGVGTYGITSVTNGVCRNIFNGVNFVASPNFAIEGIEWPFSSFSDAQTIPGKSPAEIITLTFTSPTDYTVSSSLGINGSSGLGHIDQTYIDAKTGVRLTILHGNTYSYAALDTLQFIVQDSYVCSTIPTRSVPSLFVGIQTTVGTVIGNQASLQVFGKKGNDPSIGEFYFISFRYEKTDFTTQIFTQFKNIVSQYGDLDPINPIVVGAFLAFQNGAVAVALKQVMKIPGQQVAALSSFEDALTELSKPLTGGSNADVLIPMGAPVSFFPILQQHVIQQSSIRFAQERRALIGVALGTTGAQAISLAEAMNSNRIQVFYPDGAIITITDQLGNQVEKVVDGSFIAAAYGGLDVSTLFDVAEPLTNKEIVGLTRLVRVLDQVEANQIAVNGVTIIQNQDPVMVIRQAMTTQMDTVLTREPSVTKIADFVQKSTRGTLKRFIGMKNLQGRLGDIEQSLSALLRSLIERELIIAFRSVQAVPDSADPTIIRVSAEYSPVLPINWIVVTFTLRATP